MQAGITCHGSLESNLDLLSSVMESSDDEVELPSSGPLVRSQSDLGELELLLDELMGTQSSFLSLSRSDI